jgi:hypothetical protein
MYPELFELRINGRHVALKVNRDGVFVIYCLYKLHATSLVNILTFIMAQEHGLLRTDDNMSYNIA